jgi:hypothetical protein
MSKRVLMTDAREEVLDGSYTGKETALRNQKSRLRASSRTALEELIQVAESRQIDNTEIFTPEQIYRLLDTLLTGQGGVIGDDIDPEKRAFSPSYRTELYAAVARAQVQAERRAEGSEVYALLGDRAETLRDDESEE